MGTLKLKLSQMANFIVDLQWLPRARVLQVHETVGYPICHFRFLEGCPLASPFDMCTFDYSQSGVMSQKFGLIHIL